MDATITASLSTAVENGQFFDIYQLTREPVPVTRLDNGVFMISNQVAEVFRNNEHSLVNVWQRDIGTHYIELCIATDRNDPSWLIGELANLDEKDWLALDAEPLAGLMEGVDTPHLIARHMYSDIHIRSPNAIFIPQRLNLRRKHIDHRFNLISRAASTGNPSTRHLYDLERQVIVKSIGTNDDMCMLEKYSALKRENEAYAKIKSMIDTVEIIHDGGSTILSLGEGRLVSEYHYYGIGTRILANNLHPINPYPAWVIRVSDGLQFKEMCSPKVYVSGVRLGAAGMDSVVHPPGLFMVGSDEVGRPIVFESNGTIYHRYEPYAIVKCEYCSIADEVDMRYVVTEVAFWFDRIRGALDALGVDHS